MFESAWPGPCEGSVASGRVDYLASEVSVDVVLNGVNANRV